MASEWQRFARDDFAVLHQLDHLHTCISVETVPYETDDTNRDAVGVLVEEHGELRFHVPCDVLVEALRARGYAVAKVEPVESRCEMITGHGCDAEGNLTSDIECRKPGVEFFQGLWHCAECVAGFEKEEPEELAGERRRARQAPVILDKLQRILWRRGSFAFARTEGGGALMIDADGEPMATGRSIVEAIERAPEPSEVRDGD